MSKPKAGERVDFNTLNRIMAEKRQAKKAAADPAPIESTQKPKPRRKSKSNASEPKKEA